MIRVLLFAGMRELVGKDHILLPVEMGKATVQEIKQWIGDQFPQTKDILMKSMCAVNQNYAREDQVVTDQDEIAFIPPVSGG
ncbi:MAG TPA: molybdopterin converting factor subunit 1 [Bacillota bacterium]|nr:molybdopterin converting factor subunit 1 [Bacillota bacterium]